MDDDYYKGFFVFAKKVAKAIKKAYPCVKVGIAVIGLEVPHAHIHLVPMDHMGDLQFSNPKMQFSREEFQEIASNIAKALK